jgi:hypothetical protein
LQRYPPMGLFFTPLKADEIGSVMGFVIHQKVA